MSLLILAVPISGAWASSGKATRMSPECKIFLLVIGSSDIFNRGSGFDADCLLALKEDVDIDVFAVHFERLRVFASGIDNVVINKHVISINYISAKWELLKVLRIEEIEEKPHFWVER